MLSTSYLPKLNGVTRTVSALSDGLGRRGDEVTVVTRWRRGLPRESREKATRVVRVGRGRGMGESLFFWGSMTLFTIRSCKKKEFEVVHAHGTISGLSAVLGLLIGRVPFFLSFHQDALIGSEGGYNRLNGFKRHLTRLLQHQICRLAAVVTVQSPAVKELTTRALRLDGKTRIAVLPNTVDVAQFSVDGSPPPKNRNILFVGNLIKRKGVDILMQSAATLLVLFPDLRLTIVGNGPERSQLQKLAKDLNISAAVYFANEIDDKTLALTYHTSAAVVLPSYSEVFGVVVLEALAANRPIVATATVGASSIITDGVSGRLVPVGDSKKMACAISDLFSDYAGAVEMARIGHQLVLSKYSVETVTQSLVWLYRSVAFSPANWFADDTQAKDYISGDEPSAKR